MQVPEGVTAIWPIRQDNTHGRWNVSPDSLRELIAQGHAKLGRWQGAETTLYYLARGERQKVLDGTFRVVGREPDGAVIVDDEAHVPSFLPTTQWNIVSHDAGYGGVRLVRSLLENRNFPFPKSLYAVEDALRFFIGSKQDAVVVDFFAGSGTTAHAVMRLNRQDGGRRQSISVTNNEVSVDEQAGLWKRGLRPGDPDWEALGICDYITRPRLSAAVNGRTLAGEQVVGEYKFTDEFPMAEGFRENVEFFDLTYETPRAVAHSRSFSAVSALLWMKAGSQGRRIDAANSTFDVADTYGVLFDLDASSEFLDIIQKTEGVRMAFVVTDDERSYQMVCAELPHRVSPFRLYESYLTNFIINTGRE